MAVRFPIRFDTAYRILFTALLLTPSDSFVEVEGDEVRVRMAWAFRANFPRSVVASASLITRRSRSVAACMASLGAGS